MRTETSTPGAFCWIELSTTGAASAKHFYTALFDWEARDTPMDNGVYTTFLLDGAAAAAMYEMPEEQRRRGIPPHWLLYVAVDDIDEYTERAVELGGQIVAGPFDILPYGTMAVIQDPRSAVFALWQPIEHQGAEILNEPGAFSWAELATDDEDASRDYYVSLFDWGAKIDTVDGYTQWINGRDYIGGMLELAAPGIPPHWKPFFRVTDCAATAARICDLGGSIVHGPVSIPGVGPFAVAQDPQGAVFAIVELTNQ